MTHCQKLAKINFFINPSLSNFCTSTFTQFHSQRPSLSHSPPRPCHRNHGRSPPQQHTPHLNPSSSIVDAFTLAGDVAVQLDLAIIAATAIELELQAISHVSPRSLHQNHGRSLPHHHTPPPKPSLIHRRCLSLPGMSWRLPISP